MPPLGVRGVSTLDASHGRVSVVVTDRVDHPGRSWVRSQRQLRGNNSNCAQCGEGGVRAVKSGA